MECRRTHSPNARKNSAAFSLITSDTEDILGRSKPRIQDLQIFWVSDQGSKTSRYFWSQAKIPRPPDIFGVRPRLLGLQISLESGQGSYTSRYLWSQAKVTRPPDIFGVRPRFLDLQISLESGQGS